MTDYKKLAQALRCKSLSKKCDSCGYGYHLSPDSECNDACHFEQIIADAADAIEALQAELKKTVTQIFGEEQMAWEGRCKDLMKYISDLQAEVERYKTAWAVERENRLGIEEPKRGEIVRCGECKYWSEVDTSDGLRYGQCDRPHSAIRGNCFIRESWFCADGEREVQDGQ